ncbi:MAG: peptide deformylase, partial [Alphaproteobacteria bacterium]
LAAPQIGVPKRVIVIDIDRDGVRSGPLFLANPEIVEVSEQDFSYEEGCLSVPEHFADVVRPGGITLRYLDRENEIRELIAEDVLAVCLQHEIDHLDGILFIDHISALKRGIILRKLTKAKKAAAEATV